LVFHREPQAIEERHLVDVTGGGLDESRDGWARAEGCAPQIGFVRTVDEGAFRCWILIDAVLDWHGWTFSTTGDAQDSDPNASGHVRRRENAGA